MRLFIAIDLPMETKKYLRKLQDQLPNEGISKARDFHLTLMFLGECNEARKTRVIEAMREIKFQSFKFTLIKPGTFGGKHFVRVLWIGVNAEASLFKLQSDIESRVSAIGFEVDKRNYSPHLTLARAISPGASTALAKANIESIGEHCISVNEFCLFESHLSPHGARYEILQRFPKNL